ncbi:MAG TPA: DegT/DnrJ/EryC1/StrS family aminotransferase [Thermodesulfovibrionales bacterium]|nr:DegT/DnrJ/EryC1/StrS family aminotransferase [Thermodesulfovibrionales bacterium]
MIPMVDLGRQFVGIRDDIFKMMSGILESSHYILGPRVLEFEKKVADYTGVSDAIGVASGTDALHLSVEALGIGEGDEVITTPFTFFATAEAIAYTGAKPVFVDIDPDSFNIDPGRIEEKITPRTKAILPVHLFGHPADMERIMEIAARHRLSVIEDCAQAFGAQVKGKKVGSFGNAGCFSFYPSKNLGAYGDGGMITFDDRALSETLRSLRNHGSKGSYIHESVGFNSRLDELQAGILLIKLGKIDEYNRQRRQKASIYRSLLCDFVSCPTEKKGVSHVYNQYTIMSKERDRIQKELKEHSVSSVVYYPRPLHLQKALGYLGYKEGDFPCTEKASAEVLSLPMYPELEESAIEKIAEIIKKVFSR